MTITSQGLSPTDRVKYKIIKSKFARLSNAEQKVLAKKQASIVRRAITTSATDSTSLRAEIARLTSREVINNRRFNR